MDNYLWRCRENNILPPFPQWFLRCKCLAGLLQIKSRRSCSLKGDFLTSAFGSFDQLVILSRYVS